MRRHTTFSHRRPGQTASSCPRRAREQIGALEVLRAWGVPMLLLGNGSEHSWSRIRSGVRGAVVCTSEVDEVRVGDDNSLTAEAGALLSRIARRAQRARSDVGAELPAAFRAISGRRGIHEKRRRI
ncbi:MAG: hypothetical protein ACLR4Z_08750 [Butyricicoccaceae bacterium]